jgi:hypothetical protein
VAGSTKALRGSELATDLFNSVFGYSIPSDCGSPGIEVSKAIDAVSPISYRTQRDSAGLEISMINEGSVAVE